MFRKKKNLYRTIDMSPKRSKFLNDTNDFQRNKFIFLERHPWYAYLVLIAGGFMIFIWIVDIVLWLKGIL